MKSKGMSGFGAIILIIILLVIGYVGYQIFRVQFTYNNIKSKVEDAAEIGPVRPDNDIMADLLRDIGEAKITLNPAYDSLLIDRSIPDSFRIYLAYNDSSSIFGFINYRRHLVIDIVKLIATGM